MDEDNFIAAMVSVSIVVCGIICICVASRKAVLEDEENGFYNSI